MVPVRISVSMFQRRTIGPIPAPGGIFNLMLSLISSTNPGNPESAAPASVRLVSLSKEIAAMKI